MHEHRLIERMVDVLKAEIDLIKLGQGPDIDLLRRTVDFFRMYADRCHHGKEEDILFRELKKKDLSPELRARMDELIQDHKDARQMVSSLEEATTSFSQGNDDAREQIRTLLARLVAFYPHHIKMEDNHFFHPCMEYFTKEEQKAMLDEYWEFDKNLIHEKYGTIVDRFETMTPQVERKVGEQVE
ncbi:MAG: hemerythrin domain-containing protein [Desulfovibrionales bacterium]